MGSDKIKEIEAKMARFKEIEDSLTPEARQVFLTEVNSLILNLNKDVEDYISNMNKIKATQS